jgi:3',5'-cyclic AMP phosphodiesterase CpdA
LIPLFTWVHLSDLHFGHGDPAHAQDQRLILSELLNDLRTFPHASGLKPEAILVTGDVAFSGKRREYDDASAWFGKICDALSIPLDQVFMVPGNHDVERCEYEQGEYFLVTYMRTQGAIDVALMEPKKRKSLIRRIHNFLTFANQFAKVGDDVAWVHELKREHDITIRLAGFNTSLLCDDDQDHKKLQLGNTPLTTAFASATSGPNQVVMVMTHHPFEWLKDEEKASSFVSSHAHVHLHGHIHRLQTLGLRSGTGTGLIRIVSGPGHGEAVPGRPNHGYNVGRLLLAQDKRIRLEVWPRVWSPEKSRFRTDVDSVPTHRECSLHTVSVALQGEKIHDHSTSHSPDKPLASEDEEHQAEWAEFVEEIRPGVQPGSAEREMDALRIFPGTDLYSSFNPTRQRFVRLLLQTTDGFTPQVPSPAGSRTVEYCRTPNVIFLLRDPIRPFEIQIGATRASRPGGDPGTVPLVDGLTLEAIRQMYPIIMSDDSFRWLRMVFAELATRQEVLNYMYGAEPDPEIRKIISKNPSATDQLKATDCLFCRPEFFSRREVGVNEGARMICNDYPYGPFLHYIVMPKDPIHSWEAVEETHLWHMNLLIRDVVGRGGKENPVRQAAGIRIGFNSSIRHLILGKTTRTSAGASIAHVHKQIWGLSACSVNAADHLSRLCGVCKDNNIDYLDRYLDLLRRSKLVFWEDDFVALYVPFGQISIHELQAMVKRPNSGNYLELNDDEIRSLSRVEFFVTRLYQKIGINSFNEILLLKPFEGKHDDDFRLICTFITREVDLAVSELSLAYVVDKKPEDTLSEIKKYFGDILAASPSHS